MTTLTDGQMQYLFRRYVPCEPLPIVVERQIKALVMAEVKRCAKTRRLQWRGVWASLRAIWGRAW